MKSLKKLLLLAVMACLAVSSTVFAGGNGDHKNIDNSKNSDIFIVGDSRISGLAGVDKNDFIGAGEKAFSYNSTIGAHYVKRTAFLTGQWKNKPMMIIYPAYKAQQETIIKNTLRKHGRCFVVIEGTINDICYTTESPAAMVALAKDFRKISVNGKKPVVLFTTIIPKKNQDANVKKINNEIRAKAKANKIPVIDLGLNSKWKGKYSGDTHFTAAGSKQLKKMMFEGIIKNTEYYKLSATIKSTYQPVSDSFTTAFGGVKINFSNITGK